MKDSVFFYFGIFHFRRTSDFNLVFFLFLYAQLLGYCKQFILIRGPVTVGSSAINISGSRFPGWDANTGKGRGQPIMWQKFPETFMIMRKIIGHVEDAPTPSSNMPKLSIPRHMAVYFLFLLLIYINVHWVHTSVYEVQ